jgi:hypothetical protein
MFNQYSIPKEKSSRTFEEIMDGFFNGLYEAIDGKNEEIKEETEAYKKVEEAEKQPDKTGEIHVHIHTSASEKDGDEGGD